MTTEEDIGGTQPQAKDLEGCWQPPELKEARKGSPLEEPLERAHPCRHLDFILLGPHNCGKNKVLAFKPLSLQ